MVADRVFGYRGILIAMPGVVHREDGLMAPRGKMVPEFEGRRTSLADRAIAIDRFLGLTSRVWEPEVTERWLLHMGHREGKGRSHGRRSIEV